MTQIYITLLVETMCSSVNLTLMSDGKWHIAGKTLNGDIVILVRS